MRGTRSSLPRHPDSARAVLACERLEERELPAAGLLDPAFATGGHLKDARVTGGLRAVAVQADGKVVAAGFRQTASATEALVVRYNANGTPDRSFDGDGILTIDFGKHRSAADALALQADGRIVVAGDDGTDGFHVLRLNADGSRDRTFDRDGQALTTFGGAGVTPTGMAVQADGKIVVVGRWTPAGGAAGRAVLARYNRDGSPDRTFDSDGREIATRGTSSLSANAVAVQSDGRLVVAGTVRSGSSAALTVMRFKQDGTPEQPFNGGARANFSYTGGSQAVLAQSGGKTLVAAGSTLLRFNADGTLDPQFGTGGAVNTGLTTAAGVTVQADGKILLAGTSSEGTNPTNMVVLRFTPSGGIDRTFDGDGRAVADFGGRDAASALALQGDGQVVVAGASGASTASNPALARFQTSDRTPGPVARNTTTTLSGQTAATSGQSVTLTAVVSAGTAGTPIGTVTFKDGTKVLGTVPLTAGRAVLRTSSLAAGSHRLTAVYNATGAFAGSTSAPLVMTVTPPAPRESALASLAISTNSAVFGQTVVCTTTVRPARGGAGTPSGSVTFKDGNVILGTVPLAGGAASIALRGTLPPGSHSITAVYNGDGHFQPAATGVQPLRVGKAATTLHFSMTPSRVGVRGTLTLRATVVAQAPSAAVPFGNVTFRSDNQVLGNVALDRTGTAVITLTGRLTPGQHFIVIGYEGNDAFAPDGGGDLLSVIG